MKTILLPKLSFAIFGSVLLCSTTNLSAQITYVGAAYNQDFSSLNWNASETQGSWVNNSTLPGWSVSSSVATTLYRPGWAGSQASNNLAGADADNYFKVMQTLVSGTQAGGDRVWDGNNRIGFRTGGGPGNSFATLQLTNSTGGLLNQFTISYEAAQFLAREGGAIDVRYSFDNTNWTTISGAGSTFGDVNMRYNAPVVSPGVNLNLNTAQINDSIQAFESTVSGITWANDASLYVQFAFWRDIPGGSGGHSPVLTINDVSFSAIPEPSTYVVLFGLLALGLVLYRRRR